MNKLENLTLEEKQDIVKEVNAEVTSIAKEEERTGQKINLPSGEQLIQRMSMELIRCRREINNLLPSMSKKDIQRATLAYLDLPTGEVPVYLKSPESQRLFAFGQRAIMARMVIVQYEANKLALEARSKKQQESEAANGSAAATSEG